MNIVVIGLSLSSSWGNGHATTYRALLRALATRGHAITFLECDRPWYAANRDLASADYCALRFYDTFADLDRWRAEIEAADAVIVGSYVQDGAAVSRMVQRVAGGVVAFYDIDTPVTLARLAAGDAGYVSADIIPGFDLYLSFTGGPILRRLAGDYGARSPRALYCSVDPDLYAPCDAEPRFDLGYIGTYSEDRQPALDRLLIEPARRRPDLAFVVAGPQYPPDIDWPANVFRIDHLSPGEHAAFYGSLRWTLNVTRADMVAAGFSPSVRLFEAGACGVPILSDPWPGLDTVLRPGREIVVVADAGQVIAALGWPERRRAAIGAAARTRVLAAHTAAHRAAELERYLLDARSGRGLAAA